MDRKSTCRLCFTTDPNNSGYKQIDDTTKEIFDALLINMNWTVCENPVICSGCAATAARSLRFKFACILKEQKLYSTDSAAIKELKNDPDEVTHTCTFCMDLAKYDVSHIGSLSPSVIVEMLPIFLPEKNFHSIKSLKTCSSCKTELEVYFTFLLECGRKEKNIYAYLKQSSESNTSQISVRGENGPEPHRKRDKYRQQLDGTFICDICPYVYIREVDMRTHALKHRDVVEVKYRCGSCEFEATFKHLLDKHVLVNHYIPVYKYKCTNCPYQSKWKEPLAGHMRAKHGNKEYPLKCPKCTFGTNSRKTLRLHMRSPLLCTGYQII